MLEDCNTPVTGCLRRAPPEAVANADRDGHARAGGHQHGQGEGRYYKGVKLGCVSTAPRPATLRRSAPLPSPSFGGGWRPTAAACSPPVKVVPTTQAVCAVRWPPAVISDGARRCLVAVRTSSGCDRPGRASAAARGRGRGGGFPGCKEPCPNCALLAPYYPLAATLRRPAMPAWGLRARYFRRRVLGSLPPPPRQSPVPRQIAGGVLGPAALRGGVSIAGFAPPGRMPETHPLVMSAF